MRHELLAAFILSTAFVAPAVGEPVSGASAAGPQPHPAGPDVQ